MVKQRVFSLLVILSFALALPTATFAQGPSQNFTATPLTPDNTFTLNLAKGAPQTPPVSGSGMVSVIVKLDESPLATYQGGINNLAPTDPRVTGAKRLDVTTNASRAYLNYLKGKQDAFEASAKSAIPQSVFKNRYDVVLGGISMLVPADQLKTLTTLPDVQAVYPDQLEKLETDNSPQFIGAPTVWNALGGQESAGEGVIIGVLDTGIWPEHPSFSDPDPSGKPYAPLASWHGTVCDFSGGSNPGPAFTCNNKLVGAARFMATYDAVIGPEAGYTSARDADGHGTHTSSTAGGNAGVQASIFGIPRGIVSGIAPRARIAMYKVCGVQGCFQSDSAAAVEQAIIDGVNVINFSISGGANPYSDPVELAFLDAYEAGVFVAASAGNSGPTADTTDHRGPWTTTVAASTQNRAFEDTVTVTANGGASMSLTGTSLTAGVGPLPLVVASDPPYSNAMCLAPAAAGIFTGKIVVCERGTNGRAEKGFNVLQGGAAGMILYNQAANVTDLETDNHYLPASHIQFSQGETLLTFISSHTGVMATLTQGVKAPAQGDIMASFSSRGGPNQSLGVSKPDITAPGVQVLAGASPAHLTPAQGGVALGPEGELFQAIAGTSMSSPHIAGSGALLKALHPDWTPGQIKSALMTTAWTQVVKEDGVTPANAFDDGSGRVNLNVAGDPGLTFDVSAADYIAHASDLWNVNYPSLYIPAMPGVITVQRTAHSTLPVATPWQLQVKGATDFTVSVPLNLVVPAGGDAAFNITIDARNVPIGQVRMATLYLMERDNQGTRTLHFPITFVRKQAGVALTKTCSPASIAKGATVDCTITFTNNTFTEANVNVADTLPVQLMLVPGSVSGGNVSANARTISFSGSLAPIEPPDFTIAAGSSPAGGYLPLSLFGIAPIAGVGDDTVTNFNVPAFLYGGQSYTRLGVGSNGTIIVGGATSAGDATPANQHFPDPTPPNNVIAPFWTDLNPGVGGAVRIGVLSDGTHSWIVVDWNAVKEFSTAKTDTFEVWLGISGVEDNSIAYGPVGGNGDNGLLTVGAENSFGNRGANYYYNGTGTLPANGTQLVVTGIPGLAGGTHTITFKATGITYGKWVNYAQMTSNIFQGVSVAAFAGEVTH